MKTDIEQPGPTAPSSTAVALIEYVALEDRVLIFLIKPELDQPQVFRAGSADDGQPLTDELLTVTATRLLLDFHGLPPGWDTGFESDRYRAALALSPAINAAKRGAPILERKLRNSAFQYEMTYWEGLSSALLPHDLQRELEGVELLCIVPHGALHGLPFAALRWPGGQLLSDRFGLCHLPSASVLSLCQAKNRLRNSPEHQAAQSSLIAAVAAGDDANPSEFESDGDTLSELFADRTGPNDRLLGPRGPNAASKGAVRQSLDGHDVIHLACHGVFSADVREGPMDKSGVLLSDGESIPPLSVYPTLPAEQQARFLLSAREVLTTRLQADLVTLRACSSGRTEVESGDDLLGLTRAFLYAGTPSLIVSLWNVNQRSSRMLLESFYRLWLGKRLPKWRALQAAQAWLRTVDGFDHPYHWAPFILFGDWL